MTDRGAAILRAGALLSSMMERSSARAGLGGALRRGNAVRISLASAAPAAGAVVSANAEEDEEKPRPFLRNVGEQLGVGGVLGFAAGFSIRKVGRAIMFLVGTEVVLLQYFAYRRWVEIDWRRVGRDLSPSLTTSAYDGLLDILVYKMPFAASFTGGLMAGLRLSTSK